jgi:hypothetical protein
MQWAKAEDFRMAAFEHQRKTFYKAIFRDGYPTNLSGVVYWARAGSRLS